MLIRHEMAVGGRRKNGEQIPSHYITELSCHHNGTLVMLGHWGAGIAKNPYLAFSFDGAKPGDSLRVSWIDNLGESDEITSAIG